jgi:hypothetical protein
VQQEQSRRRVDLQGAEHFFKVGKSSRFRPGAGRANASGKFCCNGNVVVFEEERAARLAKRNPKTGDPHPPPPKYSLETIMALQKLLERGLPLVEENEMASGERIVQRASPKHPLSLHTLSEHLRHRLNLWARLFWKSIAARRKAHSSST